MSEALQMDGYDDCIIGIVEIAPNTRVLCYDRDKVIRRLMQDDMSLEEAREFHDFNQSCAYMGEGTPAFIDLMSTDEAIALVNGD